MKKIVVASIFALALVNWVDSQVLSYFTWDTNPLATAVWDSQIGPDGTTYGSATRQVTPGWSGYGLAAGCICGSPVCVSLCRQNIDLVVPMAVNPGSIDINLYYRKVNNENAAAFFKRAPSLGFGTDCCGIVYIGYLLNNGGSPIQVGSPFNGSGGWDVSTPGETFANGGSGNWENYRFVYDQTTGTGQVFWNGTLSWSNTTPGNLPLYWTGSPANFTIGARTDGNGNNIATFDEYTVQVPVPLPVAVTDFKAEKFQSFAKLQWQTSFETNNDYFIVEKSRDGVHYSEIGRVKGAGTVKENRSYDFIDKYPFSGSNFYILSQIDENGTKKQLVTTELVFDSFESHILSISPNPVSQGSNLFLDMELAFDENIEVVLTDQSGRVVSIDSRMVYGGISHNEIKVSHLSPGLYFMTIHSENEKITKKLVIQ